MYTPEIIASDEDLVVREVSIGDIVAYYRVYSEPSVAAFEDFDVVVSIDAAASSIRGAMDSYLERFPEELMFSIDVQHRGVVGFFYLFPLENSKHARIGYHLDPQQQGHGYASRAVGSMLAHLRDMGFRKSSALVYQENAKSIKLLERLGYVKDSGYAKPMECKGQLMTELLYNLNF
jgi:RimJ/RimL family protein N-acetyltransferase